MELRRKIEYLIMDSATPIASATTVVAAAALTQKLTKISLGFTGNIIGSSVLVGLISITNILAEKYDIY